MDPTHSLCDTITDWWLRHDLFDPCGVFINPAIFIESYAIRGGLARAVPGAIAASGGTPAGFGR